MRGRVLQKETHKINACVDNRTIGRLRCPLQYSHIHLFIYKLKKNIHTPAVMHSPVILNGNIERKNNVKREENERVIRCGRWRERVAEAPTEGSEFEGV